MGCSISKRDQQRMESFVLNINIKTQRIEDLNEVNGQLAIQIAELKDLKNKRKPIYVVADQEIDDLYVFKTDLDKRFEKIEMEIQKIQLSLNIQQPNVPQKKKKINRKEFDQVQDEEQWLKMMMEDNDITIKPFNDPMLEELSQKLKEQEQQQQNNNSQNKQEFPNILADIQSDPKIEIENTLPKPEKQKKNLQEIQQSLAEALGDDMKDIHDGIQSKLFKQTDPQQKSQLESNSGVVINQIQLELSQKQEESKVDVNNLKTEKIKKSKRPSNTQNKQSSSQQHFYSKQATQPPVKNTKNKYQP